MTLSRKLVYLRPYNSPLRAQINDIPSKRHVIDLFTEAGVASEE